MVIYKTGDLLFNSTDFFLYLTGINTGKMISYIFYPKKKKLTGGMRNWKHFFSWKLLQIPKNCLNKVFSTFNKLTKSV